MALLTTPPMSVSRSFLAVLAAVVAGPALAQPGALDPAFGTNGVAAVSVRSTGSAARVLVRPDGRIVLAGTAGDAAVSDVALVGLTASGAPDPAFGASGVATADLAGADLVTAAALQRDGKIVTVGRGDGVGFVVARFLASGALDASFGGGDGWLATAVGTVLDEATAVAVDPEGRVVVAGYTARDAGWSDVDWVVARYLADGTPDAAFGTAGVVTVDVAGGPDLAFGLAIQPDGRLVVAGSAITAGGAREPFAAARLTASGALDPTFGTGGVALVDVSGASHAYTLGVALKADGRVVLAGTVWDSGDDPGLAVAQLTADGAPDASFGGGGGWTRVDLAARACPVAACEQANAVRVEPDGKLVAVGFVSPAEGVYEHAAVRFTADGALDTGFGTGGAVRRAADGVAADAAFERDGRLLVAGGDGGRLSVARLDPAVGAWLQTTLDGAAGWRTLASPQDTTVGAFLEPFWTQGFEGADAGHGGCTVFTYDESAPTLDGGFTCVGSASDVLRQGEGVLVYVFDDDDFVRPGVQNPFPKTLSSASVVEPPAVFAFDVAFTGDARPDEDEGWNLLGNPSGASYRWAEMARTAVRPTVYVYDPAFNGGDYRTATEDAGAVFGDLAGGLIPPFQGFFVHASGPDPALVAEAADAEPGRDVEGRRAAPVAVRVSLSDDAGERSATWLALTASGAAGLDGTDAVRLAPLAWPRAVVFTRPAGSDVALAVNALPAEPAEVALGVDLAGFEGPVSLALSATGLDGLPDGWTAVLVDHETGTEADLADGYAFTAAASGAARAAAGPATALAASGDARFSVRLGPAGATAVGEAPTETALASVGPNPTSGAATVRWSLAEAGHARVAVVDLLGREVAVLADGAHPAGPHVATVAAGRLAPGVYVVRLQAGRTVQAARLTVVR